MRALHLSWTNVPKIVIGMLHLRALPGAPLFDGNVAAIREAMLRDAEALVSGGVHGLMMENFFDTPFYPERVPAHVVAQMTALACDVKRRIEKIPLGVNVLRNDGRSALAVAHASGADFIRVNVLCGARVADQGLIQGIAHELLRERAGKATDPKHVALVKKAAGDAPVFVGSGITAETIAKFAHADGFIVGTAFKRDGVAGNPVDVARVKQLMKAI